MAEDLKISDQRSQIAEDLKSQIKDLRSQQLSNLKYQMQVAFPYSEILDLRFEIPGFPPSQLSLTMLHSTNTLIGLIATDHGLLTLTS